MFAKEKIDKKDLCQIEDKLMKDISAKEAKLGSYISKLNEISEITKRSLVSMESKYEGYETRIQQVSGLQHLIDNKLNLLQTEREDMVQKFERRISDLNIAVEERMKKINEKIEAMERTPVKPPKKVIECDRCGKQFTAEDHHRNHVLKEHGVLKNLKCYICRCTVPDVTHMPGHIRKRHKK